MSWIPQGRPRLEPEEAWPEGEIEGKAQSEEAEAVPAPDEWRENLKWPSSKKKSSRAKAVKNVNDANKDKKNKQVVGKTYITND